MAVDLEFLSASDKPSLLAISDPAMEAHAREILVGLGYKVHSATSPEDFVTRFAQINYLVLILDELFCCNDRTQNLALQKVQWMPMGQRRHCTIFLVGQNFETMHPKQGWTQSVHAVINRSDLPRLERIVQQVVADNDLFLNVYRETLTRIAQGK